MYKLTFGDAVGYVSLLISLLFCLIAVSVVLFELSFDQSYPDHRSIFRIERTLVSNFGPQKDRRFPITSPDLKDRIDNAFGSDNVLVSRFENSREIQILDGPASQSIRATQAAFSVDLNAFDLFSIELNKGFIDQRNPQANAVYISDRLAETLFAENEAELGTPLHLSDGHVGQLVGIYKAFPRNSHIQIDFITPIVKTAILPTPDLDEFDFRNAPNGIVATTFDTVTYVKLINTRPEVLQDFLAAQYDRTGNPQDQNLVLTPITSIYMMGRGGMGQKAGDQAVVRTLAIVSALVLVLATVHFLIIRTVIHQRTIGTIYSLKAIGFEPKHFIQSLGARTLTLWIVTGVIVLLGLVVAMAAFGTQLSHLIQVEDILSLKVLGIIIIIIFVVTLLSTPRSEIATIFKRPSALKWRSQSTGSFGSMRLKIIVASNFAVTVFFLIGLVAVNTEISNFLNTERGYEMNDRYVVSGWRDESLAASRLDQSEEVEKIIPALDAASSVEQFTRSSAPIPGSQSDRTTLITLGQDKQYIDFPTLYVAPNFFDFFGVSLRAGKGFETQVVRQTSHPRVLFPLVLSEAAVAQMGYVNSEAAIGQLVGLTSGLRAEVIGVVSNIVRNREQVSPEPTIYLMDPRRTSWLYVNTHDPVGVVQDIRSSLRGSGGFETIELTALKSRLEKMLFNEIARRSLLSVLCVLLCVMTLVAAFNLFFLLIHELRKELTIRQVYGYGDGAVILFLGRRLLPPVLAGIVLGIIGSRALLSLVLPNINQTPLPKFLIHSAELAVIMMTAAIVVLALIAKRLDFQQGMRALKNSNLAT